MHTFHPAHARTSHANSMDHNARIQAAITDLESQERVNYRAAAKKWNLDRTTLARRHRGETGSNQEATSYARRQLTDIQEKTLIGYINKLSDRGLPPTPQIVKNLAEEIAGGALGKNWVARFCERYQDQLISVYLRTINHKRKLADNSSYFQHFYEYVRIIFIFISYAFRMIFACVYYLIRYFI
jgi:Tc5 transposase DNA-binding domain